MIVIQSYDRFDDLVLLDESTRSLEWATKTVRPELAALPVRGHCARLNGAFVYLYRSHDGHLVLNIDNRSIRLDEQVRVTLETGQVQTLRIEAAGSALAEVRYHVSDADQLIKRVDAFCDEEDIDFGRFLLNLTRDRVWMNRIYR